MSKRVTIILIIIISILSYGCAIQDEKSEDDVKVSKEPIQSPIPQKTLEPLVESPLNDLDQEEFIKQFDALPDGQIFEVSKKLSDSGKMSKEEMSKVDFFTDTQESSLKGLRFFQNLESIELWDAHIVDIQELLLLDVNEINVRNCTFEESLDIVFQSLNKSAHVTASQLNLKNLDYFKNIGRFHADFDLGDNNISDISAMEYLDYQDINKLDLSNNEITDISVLKKFKDQKIDIRLNENKITDISVFNEFTVPLEWVELSRNRIMDVSPLQNVLDKDTVLMIGDNCVLDYSSIDSFMKNHYYKNNEYPKIIKKNGYYPMLISKNGYFRFDEPPSLVVRINQNELPDNHFVYFDTEGAVTVSMHWVIEMPIPACNAVMFIEQLGRKADYDIERGILSCTLEGKNYVFKDFENEVESEGKKMEMGSPLKRMQGGVPYMAIEDMCKVFGLNISMKYGKPFKYWPAADHDSFRVKYINEIDVSW